LERGRNELGEFRRGFVYTGTKDHRESSEGEDWTLGVGLIRSYLMKKK